MQRDRTLLESVAEYYGKILQTSGDLKTTACCVAESMPPRLRPLVDKIHPEVRERFYGCGFPVPPVLDGCTVLDLGCGAGRDVYLLSQLVGAAGRVIGIDMTDEQLAVARRHVDYHTARFGYRSPNVSFVKGYIEDLEAAGIASRSIDVVISNCVVNLSPDKRRVFREIFRVLKPGGELYFSDVFADRRIPRALAEDPACLGECLGGAHYAEDFRRQLLACGVPDYRVVSRGPVSLTDPAIEAKIGAVRFTSMTVRAFSLETLEDRCEDYGQFARYRGTIPEHPHRFELDDHHLFETGKPMAVCSNTAAMLAETRYGAHFEIVGDTRVHFGLFDCAPAAASTSAPSTGACC